MEMYLDQIGVNISFFLKLDFKESVGDRVGRNTDGIG
jgi:hypothetical protein